MNVSFEAFTVVMFQVKVFWTSETLASYHNKHSVITQKTSTWNYECKSEGKERMYLWPF